LDFPFHFQLQKVKVDDLVKSLKRRISVIPANPGSGPGQAPESSYFKYLKILWTPVSTGVTTFYETIKVVLLFDLFYHSGRLVPDIKNSLSFLHEEVNLPFEPQKI